MKRNVFLEEKEDLTIGQVLMVRWTLIFTL